MTPREPRGGINQRMLTRRRPVRETEKIDGRLRNITRATTVKKSHLEPYKSTS